MYPRKINFTFKGDQEFKTLLGGVISIFVRCISLTIALILTVAIFQRTKNTVSIDTVFKDLTNDTEKHYFAQDGRVSFALKLIGPDSDKLLDWSYFNFTIYQTHMYPAPNDLGFIEIIFIENYNRNNKSHTNMPLLVDLDSPSESIKSQPNAKQLGL